MPAEWEPHEATWLGWPHNPTDWPGKLDTIRWVYGEIVRKIAPGEEVRILVDSRAEERLARRRLAARRGGPRARAVRPAPDQPGLDARQRAGLRAAGASGRRSETAIVHFHFNAWAKYRDWRKDRRVPETAARLLGKRLFDARVGRRDFVLEGGGIDVNGRGTLLTTEECYLSRRTQVRNPGLGRKGFEAALRDVARRHATCSGSDAASPATTPTATSTTSAAS